ncbi:MAG: transcriptional regulator NrdR [Verrucomicrobiota bacterium]
MQCIQCGSLDDKVIDSRMSKDGTAIRRRRECIECGNRFTTYEHLERSDLRVIKRDGVREDFRREKLLDGIAKACEKRPVSIEAIEQAVEDIISELYAENIREIPSSRIGPLVMKKLQEIDPVAYVRYASVYRQFKDVGEFIHEIESLERMPQHDPAQEELFNSPSSS